MKSILSILTLVLILNISNSVAAIEGTCIQGNCNNGYGIFVFDDGRVYEGQWKNDVKKKIAEQEAKAKAQAPTKIVLEGSARPRTKLYGRSSTSTTKVKYSGKATANSERRYQVPDKVNRLMKSGLNQGQHVSPGPVFTPNTYK